MDNCSLSLRDMVALTGIAFKTIDRYRKGAIPDPSNAKFLKMIMRHPFLVMDLMEENEHFQAARFKKMKEKLRREIERLNSEICLECPVREAYGRYIIPDRQQKPEFDREWEPGRKDPIVENIAGEAYACCCGKISSICKQSGNH
ncbi:MAG: hypothetical protein P8184_10855 [Calditrichia bacterium]